MKVGISINIDVTKLDKSRFVTGKKGTYCSLTTFVNLDEKDQYDNNGFVTQSPTKEEREAKEQMPILGNVKVFFTDGESKAKAGAPQEDIPF